MPGSAIENGRWLGGGAEGRRERLLHRAAHRHRRSIPLARDAHKTAITAQHSVLLVRRRRPIDHPPGGPCSYGHVDGMGLGRVGDATPAAAVVDWRAVGWARECGGEIVIGPGPYCWSFSDRCRRRLLNCGGTPLVRTLLLELKS